ncbi:nitrite reductase small subunit NirD [Chromohalobacter canadensis]|uniref:Nitrite reductase small subunit NirD n=1 Tax=Chromohalobacter canadensis TaxID=141389 RepID=A0ABZ0Y927_9GAMM|nr:nitrite reductase small subunit NirD [Chromohalobacter canadensis]MCK0767836.1 nitrite reductase small subunit NirD [Chromohalobacter canadensis]WQH08406.1 nitrite reductase small subunit NirD [Chromohalobacter canadensis]
MNAATAIDNDVTWQTLCSKADLVAHSGVAAWLASADTQVALLYLPGLAPEVYAVDNHDPFSNANVIARGIVGDIKGEPVIASPIYKQHFRLSDGVCVEDENVRLRTWEVKIEDEQVMIKT